MRTLIVITFMLPANVLFAQTREDTVVKIVSYGINVYVQDTFSFSETERNAIASVSSEIVDKKTDLLQAITFFKANGLKTISDHISLWQERTKSANELSKYVQLVEFITNDLSDGGKNADARRWRKEKVPTLFTEPMHAYLKQRKKNEGDAAGKGKNGSLATPQNKDENMYPILALLLAGLSLAGVIAVLLIFYKKVKSYDESRRRHRADIEQLKTEISQFKNNSPINSNANTKSDLVSNQRIQDLEKRITLLENKQQRAAEIPQSLKRSSESITPVNIKKEGNQIKNAPEILYAKRPDLDNGFSQSELVTTQDGDQVYQIEVKDNTTTFIITNDLKAQKYALSDFRYYLEKACEFLNDPTPNCRIDTKTYGELIKDGSKWIIKSKAQIMFV